ncbi:MAG: hypothetical protein ABI282_11875 [Candidatus Baltobacteraceae bacterium]
MIAIAPKSGAALWRNSAVCDAVDVVRTLNDQLFIGCHLGRIALLNTSNGRVLRSTGLRLQGINEIVPAGNTAIAVQGWNDGAALRSDLSILRVATFRRINRESMTDSTFLGTIGNRAYIDDWCCFGRPDVYRPATIYSVSLADGSQSEPVDLRPDPEEHPARLQPLGQGENNYLIGTFLYVPVGENTYRYDILNLGHPPVRLR